jgi:hypothetical protein
MEEEAVDSVSFLSTSAYLKSILLFQKSPWRMQAIGPQLFTVSTRITSGKRSSISCVSHSASWWPKKEKQDQK